MDIKGRIGIMETEIIKINPKNIKLLKLNERYMEPEKYDKLVANIKNDGKLTSVPFCHFDDDNNIEVLSENHRIMASIDAGIEEIEIMLCKKKLSKEQCIAIQLSHNSITGQDDEQILKELFNNLNTLDLKQYSGITDDFINFCKETEKDFKFPLLNYQSMNLLFLPEEINTIEDVLKQIASAIDGNPTILSSMKEYDKYLSLTTTISKCLNIKNPSTTFLALIKLATNHIDELKELSFKDDNLENIPISSIIGKSDIKKEYAKEIDTTLSKMVDCGLIKNNEKDKGLMLTCRKYNNFINSKKV